MGTDAIKKGITKSISAKQQLPQQYGRQAFGNNQSAYRGGQPQQLDNKKTDNQCCQ